MSISGQGSRCTGDDGEEPEIHFGSTVGTCEDMCPQSEVERRVRLDDFDELERPLPGDATPATALAVKRFARTIVSGEACLMCGRSKQAVLVPAIMGRCMVNGTHALPCLAWML